METVKDHGWPAHIRTPVAAVSGAPVLSVA
jgi:hypothetical protein